MTWINVPDDNTVIDRNAYVGFVYIIHERDTGMCYVGQKKFWNSIRRKPLKGKKRVRRDRVESDWKTYNSSSKIMQEKIADNPDNYVKYIIRLCETKMEMNIYETYKLLELYVNGRWDLCYNECINMRGRIRKSGDKNIVNEKVQRDC